MWRKTLFLILRALEIGVWVCLVAYMGWQFSHGRHVGDDGTAGLIVLLGLRFAANSARPRVAAELTNGRLPGLKANR